MSFIFISYSRQDQTYVSKLVEALESHHLPVWLDNHIDYGTTWPRIIQEQLEKCGVFLLVMSPRSLNSHWVQCELSLALELKKPIFPLRLEGGRWLAVAAIQTVDVTASKLPPARFFEKLGTYFPRPTALPSPPSQVRTPPPEDELSTEKDLDYTRLRNLLKTGDWKTADQETYAVMIRAVDKQPGDWFKEKELLNFPCIDLRTIDRLWVKYSRNKFGFSRQKKIYVECGAKLDGKYPGDEIWRKFCDRVDWRRRGDYIYRNDVFFDLSSPVGHLPFGGVGGWGGGWGDDGGLGFWFFVLFCRIQICGV